MFTLQKILGRPQAIVLFALSAGTMLLLLGAVILISQPFSQELPILPETGAPACDPAKLNMKITPSTIANGDNVTFSIKDSTEGDLWIKDTWSGGVNCTGLVSSTKTCKATANGTFKWTHKWKKCTANNTNECSAECTKTVEYKIGTTSVSPTPATSCISQLDVNCSADNKQATFEWKGASAATGYILRVDHEPGNTAQCINTISNQNVGWYCPASEQCQSPDCDDKFVQFNSSEPNLSRTVSVVPGASYSWAVEALRADANCRVDATQPFSCEAQGGTACGPMDTDANGNLDLIDFSNFAKVYRKTCGSTTGQTTTCGSQDADPASGTVDLYDFNKFASHYRKSDCQ